MSRYLKLRKYELERNINTKKSRFEEISFRINIRLEKSHLEWTLIWRNFNLREISFFEEPSTKEISISGNLNLEKSRFEEIATWRNAMLKKPMFGEISVWRNIGSKPSLPEEISIQGKINLKNPYIEGLSAFRVFDLKNVSLKKSQVSEVSAAGILDISEFQCSRRSVSWRVNVQEYACWGWVDTVWLPSGYAGTVQECACSDVLTVSLLALAQCLDVSTAGSLVLRRSRHSDRSAFEYLNFRTLKLSFDFQNRNFRKAQPLEISAFPHLSKIPDFRDLSFRKSQHSGTCTSNDLNQSMFQLPCGKSERGAGDPVLVEPDAQTRMRPQVNLYMYWAFQVRY